MSASIDRLALAFWEICRLRLGPKDLPDSGFLFRCVLTSYVLLGAGINLIGFAAAEAWALSITMTVLLLVTTQALLLIRGYPRRMQQTATAIMGTQIVLFAPALALRYWFHLIERAESQSALAGYFWLGLFVWELFISAHILRHALNTRLLVSFFISVAYVFLEFRVLYFVHYAFK